MKFAELPEVMVGAASAGKVPSPGFWLPESIESGWTWKACEKTCGAVMPVSPPPPSPT